MEIHELTACEMKERLDRGELSSVEIVEALFRRADAVEPRVHALVHRFHEQALADARAADGARARGETFGPLHGLPITVKENVDVEGVASTIGIRARLGKPASADAVTVRVARERGAIVIGKSNVPQTLLSPMETTNHIWGTTNNPWNLGRGPGGSSGGEGAAIASGSSVLGIGTDIGGSIRIPAAFCGVVGLKPTLSRWSNAGSNTVLAGQETIRSQIGPMARSVADVSLLLRAIDSPLHSPHDPVVPPLPIGDPREIDARKLRIGWYEDDGFFTPAASQKRAVREAVRALEAAGAELVPYAPPRPDEVTYLYFAALSSDGGVTLEEVLGGEEVIAPLRTLRRVTKLPPPVRATVARAMRVMGEHRVARLLDSVGKKGVERLWRLTAQRTRDQLDELAEWRKHRIDALVCPVHVTPAAPHGTSHDFTIAFCHVARYNLLNLPAGVVPVTRVRGDETVRPNVVDRLDKRAAEIEAASEGLPVGVQVVARPWREDVALAVMGAIEQRVRESGDFPRTPVDP